jgi:PAS domain S-box-containing protein
MRNNGAVSGREIDLHDEQVIISRADRQGRITYVNAAFIEISGFTEEELLGQPHSILRHPDMPAALFADLWRDIQAGRPWVGILKNRCRNGDAYWVEAHVSPIWEKGEIVGYLSMRRKPSPDMLAAARQAFAAMTHGEATGFHHGEADSSSTWRTWRKRLADAPLGLKFVAASLLATSLILGSGTWFIADHLSRTLDEDARRELRQNVSLLTAAVSARIEGADIEVTEYSKVLSERIYEAMGGQPATTMEALQSLVAAGQSSGEKERLNYFLRDLRGVFTLFVLTEDGFERRLTTATDQSGQQVNRTLLAPDHPALAVLLAGKTYHGPARVFGRHYLTTYTPIVDGGGKVIGASAIGIDTAGQLDTLKERVRSMRVGKTGYYYIADISPGPDFGTMILHPFKEGRKFSTPEEQSTVDLFFEMARLRAGEITYAWRNEEAGERVARDKLVMFESLDDPKWLIAGGSATAEFTALSHQVVWMVVVGGLAMTAAIFAIVLLLLRRLFLQPLSREVFPTFLALAAGKFDTPLDVRRNDEIGKINQGLENLRNRLAFENERERALSSMREAARQEAEALVRTRSEFLANMSHEIRTPLNAVIGLAYLLLQGRLEKQEMEYVKRIEGAGKMLLGIINDVLDFSKIDAGKMQIEETPFRLDEILDNLANLVRNRIHEKHLVLDYVVAPGTPQALRGDALHLSQVLVNLLGNAIKFTAEGSITVFVQAHRLADGRSELEFRIRDTGIGMSPEQMTKLFQAFTQADTSVTRRFGGTGLGLVICKRLVEMMGGSIWADSTPQLGTTFAFRLPLAVDPASGNTPHYSGYRVLVVDNHEQARQALAEQLLGLGCRVVTAATGEAALDALREAKPAGFDCVMIDLRLPEIEGLAVAHHIADGNDRKTRLVMLSGEDVHTTRYQQALDDFDDFIEKPITATRLSETIDRLRGASQMTTVSALAVRPSAPLAGLHILVAEDVPTNQLVIQDLLESLGATVEVADNGKIAVNRLSEAGRSPDLVLMDIQMPEMDGLEATRLIRAGQQRPDIPVIALTAQALDGEKQRALAAGMSDFLTKPIDPEQLIVVIRRWKPRSVVAPAPSAEPAPPASPPALASLPPPADFPEIPGLDVGDGLRHMGQRRPLYEKVLGDFAGRFDGEAERIRASLAAGDIALATRQAHSLKGTGGMIGALGLAALAAELERAIKQDSPQLEAALNRFDDELGKVIGGIKAHLAGDSSA